MIPRLPPSGVTEAAGGSRRNARSSRIMVTLPNAAFDRLAARALEAGCSMSALIASMVTKPGENTR